MPRPPHLRGGVGQGFFLYPFLEVVYISWNYSGDPSVSSKDAVRFLVGDTNPDEPLVQDEEIVYMLALETDPKGAAAAICEALSAKFATAVDMRLGDYSISMSQKAESFAARARQLRIASGIRIGVPYAGGISVSDKGAQEEDDDRVQPAFRRRMMNNPGSGDEEDERWDERYGD